MKRRDRSETSFDRKALTRCLSSTSMTEKFWKGLLVGAGIALIIEQKTSLAGAVGGCLAETGSAAAMASGAIV